MDDDERGVLPAPAPPRTAQRHLPGAVNLVAEEADGKLERLGYTNLRKYTVGIQDWEDRACHRDRTW